MENKKDVWMEYVEFCSQNLKRGFSLIENKEKPVSNKDVLFKEAAEYLIGRGFTKDICLDLKFGVAYTTEEFFDLIGGRDAAVGAHIYIRRDGKLIEILKGRITLPTIVDDYVYKIDARAIKENFKSTAYYRYICITNKHRSKTISLPKNSIKFVEGILDLASYRQITGNDDVRTMQSFRSIRDIEEAIAESHYSETEAVLCFHDDEVGINKTKALGESLVQLGIKTTVVVMPSNGTAYNYDKVDLNAILQFNTVPKAKKIWEDLYANRISFEEFCKLSS